VLQSQAVVATSPEVEVDSLVTEGHLLRAAAKCVAKCAAAVTGAAAAAGVSAAAIASALRTSQLPPCGSEWHGSNATGGTTPVATCPKLGPMFVGCGGCGHSRAGGGRGALSTHRGRPRSRTHRPVGAAPSQHASYGLWAGNAGRRREGGAGGTGSVARALANQAAAGGVVPTEPGMALASPMATSLAVVGDGRAAFNVRLSSSWPRPL